MTIKQHGGVFGRNPKFNNVEVESLSIAGNPVPDASTLLVDGDIGSTVQGYDADTAKYDDATANFTGTLQNGGSNVLVDSDIGSTVQGYDAGLNSIAGLTTASDKMIYTTASDTYAVADLTSAGRAILDDADAAAQRTTLGLGTIATQDANDVNIDGGTVDGISSLTVDQAQVVAEVVQATSIDCGGINFAAAVQGANEIRHGVFLILTTGITISNVPIRSGDDWRVIFIGSWANYYNGFSVNGPANYLEVTSANNVFNIGGVEITITRDGTSEKLVATSTGANAYRGLFQGQIIISQSGGSPANSFDVNGGIKALGTYSATVGATNRDLFVDDTGLIGYVSSVRDSKTNIENIDDVSWLSSLQPVTFNRRKKEQVLGGENGLEVVGEQYSDDFYEEIEYGLIAEDVEIVNDELCFYDEVDGVNELRGVHYQKLIVPLLKKVQQLAAEVERLSAN